MCWYILPFIGIVRGLSGTQDLPAHFPYPFPVRPLFPGSADHDHPDPGVPCRFRLFRKTALLSPVFRDEKRDVQLPDQRLVARLGERALHRDDIPGRDPHLLTHFQAFPGRKHAGEQSAWFDPSESRQLFHAGREQDVSFLPRQPLCSFFRPLYYHGVLRLARLSHKAHIPDTCQGAGFSDAPGDVQCVRMGSIYAERRILQQLLFFFCRKSSCPDLYPRQMLLDVSPVFGGHADGHFRSRFRQLAGELPPLDGPSEDDKFRATPLFTGPAPVFHHDFRFRCRTERPVYIGKQKCADPQRPGRPQIQVLLYGFQQAFHHGPAQAAAIQHGDAAVRRRLFHQFPAHLLRSAAERRMGTEQLSAPVRRFRMCIHDAAGQLHELAYVADEQDFPETGRGGHVDRAADNFAKFQKEGWLVQDEQEMYYIYAQTMNGKTQYGLVVAAAVEDYMNGVIKKHELTRRDKEEDRMRHVRVNDANLEPVFFAYPDNTTLDSLIKRITEGKAEYDFIAPIDGFRHQFWLVKDAADIATITDAFAQIPYLYIADGHHRSAAAALVGAEKAKSNPNHKGDEEYNYFMAVCFPASQLTILDYNRVVKDLNGMTEEQFLSALSENFTVECKGTAPYRAKHLHEFSLYLGGKWYSLDLKEGLCDEADPIGSLDVSISSNLILDSFWVSRI